MTGAGTLQGRIFYGWFVVGAAFLVLFLAYGAQYSFGVFLAALLDEFGWTRASLSGIFSIYAFVYCLCSFPAGRLTDRWGPRAVIGAGGVLLGSALAAMALVTRLWQPYLLYGGVAALGMGTAYVPCNSTVVKWFVRRRGLAVGIASTGGSVGTIVLPLVAQVLVGTIGWRGAYVVFGVAIALLVNVAARFMYREPESLGLHPDGVPEAPVIITAGPPDWSLGDAMRTPGFWLLGAAFAATWFTVFIPLVHLVPLARDLGYSPVVSASMVSALGTGAVAGRLVMGAVSDRLGRTPIIAGGMLMQALTFLGFVVARDLGPLYGTALVFGFSYGAISTMFPAIVGDFFGRRHAGVLVGFLFALGNVPAGSGPLIAGVVYDVTRSYSLAFELAAASNLVALALLLFARPPSAVKTSRRTAAPPTRDTPRTG